MKKEIVIPQGSSAEDIKKRRQIIKDFYSQWIAKHPDKVIWNESIRAYINVKWASVNEALGHAPRSIEATRAQFRLTEALSMAKVVGRLKPKYGNNNQKPYSELFLLRWKHCRLIVGYQKTKNEYVLYYLSGGQKK